MPGRKKEYTEPRTLQYRFLRILKSLGIPSFNFHMLRHIFATNCISHGFDMKTVSELLGHSNVTTTMRIYVHSDMQRKKMADGGLSDDGLAGGESVPSSFSFLSRQKNGQRYYKYIEYICFLRVFSHKVRFCEKRQ